MDDQYRLGAAQQMNASPAKEMTPQDTVLSCHDMASAMDEFVWQIDGKLFGVGPEAPSSSSDRNVGQSNLLSSLSALRERMDYLSIRLRNISSRL